MLSKLLRKDETKAKSALYIATMAYVAIYLIWRIAFTIPFSIGWVEVTLSILLLVCELTTIYEAGLRYYLYTRDEELVPPVLTPDEYPHVDVLVTVHSESVELMYATMNACAYLKYPDKSKVHVYLCDDSCRPEMEALAKELGVGYFACPDNKEMKAGNMNYALKRTFSPYIVTLDADMIPRSEFLVDVIPYFYIPRKRKDANGNWVWKSSRELDNAERVALVQTPQSFYNESVVNFNLGLEKDVVEEQDLFFRVINPTRNAINAAHYCGSNAIISRESFEELGYMPTTTITEDYQYTIRLEKAGFRTYAVGEQYVQGLSPSTVGSLISQRRRWASGNLAVWREEKPVLTSKELSTGQRMAQLGSLIYWLGFPRKMVFLIIPILSLLFGVVVLDGSWWGTLLIWLPYYVLYFASIKSLAGNIWASRWTSVFETILAPQLTLSMFEELIGKKSGFVVTDKDSLQTKSIKNLRYAVPQIVLLVLSILAILYSLRLIIVEGKVYFVISLAWLVYNMLSLAIAIKFMYGRNNYRKTFRFYKNLETQAVIADKGIIGQLADISKGGVGISIADKKDLQAGDHLTFRLNYREYETTVSGSIASIKNDGDSYRLGIQLDELAPGQDKRQYYQIVFDRKHSMPMETNKDVTLLKTLVKNV